jgi:hypothetical protein
MHGLKILRHQVCISARHLQSGMPKHLLKMEHAAALPQIVDGECVPEGVQGSRRGFEA